ncbi:MAG: long-chain fatty acid--CoA ligase [Lentisphaerae bacterium]|nr:long-chain fatty acid--CoA ligase [Lentisphaerota bacterium]
MASREFFEQLRKSLEAFGTAPTFAEMPRRSLEAKSIAGPTAAHTIEEIHVPLNVAGITFTTGTSALQNIVGIAHEEMPLRKEIGLRVLKLIGAKPGDKLLCCYPPLINVFTSNAFGEAGVSLSFLRRSSRDAFLEALYYDRPDLIIGESTFIKVALEDAIRMDIHEDLPGVRSIMVAGTPLDTDMPAIAEELTECKVFDVYGCQEFGWIAVNGEVIRDDISLIDAGGGQKEVIAGGLPVGDIFPVGTRRHILSESGNLITYRRQRTVYEKEVVVRESSVTSLDTLQRAVKTILRLKSKVVKIHPDVKLGSDKTVLWIKDESGAITSDPVAEITGPDKTAYFDLLIQAQLNYQLNPPKDPAWLKIR